MNATTLRIIVVSLITGLWGLGAVVVAITGNSTLLKVTTPMMTMALGWLLTEKAANGAA